MNGSSSELSSPRMEDLSLFSARLFKSGTSGVSESMLESLISMVGLLRFRENDGDSGVVRRSTEVNGVREDCLSWDLGTSLRLLGEASLGVAFVGDAFLGVRAMEAARLLNSSLREGSELFESLEEYV